MEAKLAVHTLYFYMTLLYIFANFLYSLHIFNYCQLWFDAQHFLYILANFLYLLHTFNCDSILNPSSTFLLILYTFCIPLTVVNSDSILNPSSTFLLIFLYLLHTFKCCQLWFDAQPFLIADDTTVVSFIQDCEWWDRQGITIEPRAVRVIFWGDNVSVFLPSIRECARTTSRHSDCCSITIAANCLSLSRNTDSIREIFFICWGYTRLCASLNSCHSYIYMN